MKNLIHKLTALFFISYFSLSIGFAQQNMLTINAGHSGELTSVALSPDGKYALSGAEDKTVKLWDISTGKEIRSLNGHSEQINVVKFSPDGKSVLSGSRDGNLKLWDIASGNVIRSFLMEHNSVYSACFSPDGKYIISANNGNIIRIWEVSTGTIISTFTAHKEQITSVDISADGNYILTGSWDKTVKLWEFPTGKELKTFFGHTGWVISVCFSPDGKYALSGGGNSDSMVKLWDVSTGIALRTFSGKSSAIESVCFSPDGKSIAVGFSYLINLWDVATGALIRTIEGHNSTVESVCFSSDGNYILSGSDDKTLKLWETSSGKEIRVFSGKANPIESVCFSPDGKYFLSGGEDEIMTLWDVSKGAVIKSFFGHTMLITSTCFSPDGKYALSSSRDKTFILWNIAKGEAVKTFYNSDKSVSSVCFSPDGKFVVSGSNDNYVRLWDITKGKLVWESKGHSKGILSVSFSPNAEYVLSGSSDKSVKLWKASSGVELNDFTEYSGASYSVCFSPDSKFVLVGRSNGKMELWEISSAKKLKTFNIESLNFIQSVCFSPDGQTALSGSQDRIIRLWDIASGSLIKTFEGHTSDINSVCFSPDGKMVLSGSNDNTIKLWNIAKGELIYTAIANIKNAQWLVYNNEGFWDASPNGGELVAMVNGVEVWNIDQFAVKNNRPDKILEKLPNASPDLISHYNNQYIKRLRKLNLTEEMLSKDNETPMVKITKILQNEKKTSIDFTITNKTVKIIRYNIFINDVPLFGAYGKKTPAIAKGSKIPNPLIFSETIELTKGNNKIEISAMNAQGAESFRALASATYSPSVPLKSNLYYIGFGVSKYNKPELNLQYADKDAKDLADVFKKMNDTSRFANVFSKTYLNEEVTPESIKAAKAFLKDAKVDDTFILFIAGHGTHDNDKDATYYYLTSNADPNNLKGTAANFESIEDLLQGIAPRNKLFLMDACESGEIDTDEQGQILSTSTGVGIASRGFKKGPSSLTTNNQQPTTKRSYLDQKDRYIYNDLARRSGAIVFSSSKGGELSYERSDIENGLFTESIIKAFSTTEADMDENGIIGTDELRKYVTDQVAKASGSLQHPVVDRDNIFQKFDFSIKEVAKAIEASKYGIFNDPRDGKAYKTVKIGNQIWMAENLNYNIEGSWCYDDNKDMATKWGYGRLYDLNSAKAACPAGWHLPSNEEWKELSDFLGGADVAGGKMKETRKYSWKSPNIDATNSSNFSALPGGYRYSGKYYQMDLSSCWWSSTEKDASNNFDWRLRNTSAILEKGDSYKYDGCYVRCIKD